MVRRVLLFLFDTVEVLEEIGRNTYSLFAGPVRYRGRNTHYEYSNQTVDRDCDVSKTISIEYEDGGFRCPECENFGCKLIEAKKNVFLFCPNCGTEQCVTRF